MERDREQSSEMIGEMNRSEYFSGPDSGTCTIVVGLQQCCPKFVSPWKPGKLISSLRSSTPPESENIAKYDK